MSDHRRPGPGGPRGPGGMGGPVEKPKDARTTWRRLLALLRPHGASLTLGFTLGVVGSLFSVLGPQLLGQATNLIVEGMKRSRIDFGALESCFCCWVASTS